jgi:hypothetical protein
MDFTLVPMGRFFLDACQNDTIRIITLIVSVQSGKTKTASSYLVWKAHNDPRDVIWYTDTAITAKADYKVKLRPFFENCDAVSAMFPTARGKAAQTLVQFDSMNLHILGAEARANRENKTAFEVLCDEARNYKPGALAQIDGRLKTIRSSKRIVFSSAGTEYDDLHRAWLDGTRHLFFWTCPHCQHKQTFRFGREATTLYPEPRKHGGFIWDTNAVTKPKEDEYNFQELAKTVRYECENPSCLHRFHKSERLALMRTLEPLQTNPNADPANISMHWWEAYMPWADCEWDRIVIKFLRAQLASKRGDFEPLKVFVTESLGEPWRPPPGEKLEEAEILERCGEYSFGEEWPPDVKCGRILTCDVQHGFLVYVYRAYRPDRASRLVECGRLLGFDELRHYQVAHGIGDEFVGIDCAHKPRDVQLACLRYGRWKNFNGLDFWSGWHPMLGDDAEEFSRTVKGTTLKTFWKEQAINVNEGVSGTPAFVGRVSWCGNHYKDRLYRYSIRGKSAPWEIPKNISTACPDYAAQLSATEWRDELDAQGQKVGGEWFERGRHDYGDCELMQTVIADLANLKA